MTSPTGAAAISPTITRVGVPAIISSAIHTVQTMIVWPKSGCIISSPTTSATIPPVMTTVGRLSSFALSDSSHARVTIRNGFRNSDGWNWTRPGPSQRRAPLTVTPMNGVAARAAVITPAPINAMRRAAATGIIDTPISTGSDTAIHTSWRQK